MATIYRRRRIARRRRPFLLGIGANVTLIASAGSYSLTGNPIAFNSRLNAVSGAYVINGSDVGLNVKLVAAAGLYSLSGQAAAFEVKLRADDGAYAITGNNIGLNTRFVAVGGSYSITGGAISGFVIALLAQPGAYQITGNAVAFPQVFVLEPGAYQIALGEYELRRTGGEYDKVYGGIGHYLEEAARLRQLNAITRKVPPPVVRAAPPNLRQSQPQAQRAPTPDLLQMLQVAATQRAAVAEQQALAKRKRQEAEILFLLAS